MSLADFKTKFDVKDYNSRERALPTLMSPTTVRKNKETNWKKVSRLIFQQQDMLALDPSKFESNKINSGAETKRFLQKIEEDIGIKKLKIL